MYFLLELRDKIKDVYTRHNLLVRPLVRFVVAIIAMLLMNVTIGYMTKLKNPLIVLLLGLVCGILPSEFSVVIMLVFMLAHLYAISAEFALIALCIALVMYLLYIRFSPKQGYIILATVVLCMLKIPAAVPIIIGVGMTASAIVPVSFGILIYNIIRTASDYETAIANSASSGSVQQISYIAESFLSNRACIVMILAAILAMVVITFTKKLTVNNSWTYALIAGTFVEFLILVVGIVTLDAKIGIVSMIVGLIVGVVGGYICKIILFSVDYKRTEFVQYEDDEYYYYVKAVPKIIVTGQDVRVKQISGKKTKKTDSAPVRRVPESSPRRYTEDEDSIKF